MIELEFQEYVEQIKKTLTAQIKLANQARSLKYDPYSSIESIITPSSTDNILAILNIPGLENYLPEKINQNRNLLLLAADVAKQIVNGRFIKKPKEQLILLAIQSSFVILSRGQCSVPKEYVPKVRIDPKQNYLTLFFANTIRYVPGTIIGLAILISDYLRGILHLNRFHSSPDSIGRYEEELEIFLKMNDRVFQFNVDHVRVFIQNIGVELSSEPYERIEVQRYRNLPKLTNHLRMGLCVTLERILHDLQPIIIQKLQAGIPEWGWLDKLQFIIPKQNRTFGTEDIRSTQPLLSQSNRAGGFRLRYGESRITGFGTIGIHPVTMALTGILTPGCTVQLDFSDKFYAINPVSSIMGPLVELEDGSLKRINSLNELRKMKISTKQIWEMGDILMSTSDIPISTLIIFSAWTEEWWNREIKSAIATKEVNIAEVLKSGNLSEGVLNQMLHKPLNYYPTWDLAILLSKAFDIPLHPKFSLNWNEIAISDFILLVQKLKANPDTSLHVDDEILRIIKQLGASFEIIEEKIHSEILNPFFTIFKQKFSKMMEILKEDVEELTVEFLCQEMLEIPVRSLCYRRIGFKLIRIEKAETRFTNPPHHSLFPLGKHGGPQKDFFKVSQDTSIEIRVADRYCISCKIYSFKVYCPECKQKTEQKYRCREGHTSDNSICSQCEKRAYPTKPKMLNINGMLNSGIKKAGSPEVKKVKGVSYLDNTYGIPENLIKGILRAKHGLFVFKDGTTRFNYTNSPIRTFTSNEISTSLDEIQRLGYSHDIYGEDLTDEEQLIEIFPYDIIINKKGAKFVFAQSKFIDDELAFQYNSSPYYRLQSYENVIGLLVVGISPTSQVGVIGRIIGYSKNNVLFAHPLWHLLKSRSCNGATDSITLLLDVLLNFSSEFIPASHGGALDIPSVINLVDSWVDLLDYSKHNISVMNRTFYQEIPYNLEQINVLSYEISLLTSPEVAVQTSNDISAFSIENKFIEKKIVDRINIALESLQSIRGVEEGKYVDNLLINDFLIKITLSISRFFQQPVRCKLCKTTYRRVPLSDKCPVCNNKTLELTLSKGWVLRYLQIINQLSNKYSADLSEYTKSWIRYIELNKNLLFDVGPRPTTLFFNDST
ncbi:hypothetical protein CEE45_06820 [Candidatus Heimdallarchaeota archaeon B3_Heim]|nr:MAG: hypothetical protein CEE45_06820 [Candidatus Heimdallarchaeota archaeon B3_Heim]